MTVPASPVELPTQTHGIVFHSTPQEFQHMVRWLRRDGQLVLQQTVGIALEGVTVTKEGYAIGGFMTLQWADVPIEDDIAIRKGE